MKIFASGTVQGVGFRPTVYRVAKSLGLKGYVLNWKGSLHRLPKRLITSLTLFVKLGSL
ncbi:MAG: acylphosphatase, partial [Methanosarcinales archaeon]|nr:acylphosphatase [Methanosarcinales archaeon]